MDSKQRVEPCTTAYMAAITCDLSVVTKPHTCLVVRRRKSGDVCTEVVSRRRIEQESDLRRAHRKIPRGFDVSGFLNVFVIEDGVEEAFTFLVEFLELMSGLMREVFR